MFRKAMVAAFAAATLVLGGGAAVASASTAAPAAVVSGPTYNTQLAGYQTTTTADFNQVRGTVTAFSGAKSDPGLVLADNTQSGPAYVIALRNEHDGARTVEYISGTLNGTAFTPSELTPNWVPTNVRVADGNSEYLEVYNSTATNQIVFVSGSEANQFVIGRIHGVRHQVFSAPSAGNFANGVPVNAMDAAKQPFEQSSFTRVGVTVPVNNHGLKTGTRYSYATFAQDELVATNSDSVPQPNQPSEAPTAFGVGSSFRVNLSTGIFGIHRPA